MAVKAHLSGECYSTGLGQNLRPTKKDEFDRARTPDATIACKRWHFRSAFQGRDDRVELDFADNQVAYKLLQVVACQDGTL